MCEYNKSKKSSGVCACVLYEILPPCVHWGLAPGTWHVVKGHVFLVVMLAERKFDFALFSLYTTLFMDLW